MRGRLFNTYTGEMIAKVEGVETVRSIGCWTTTPSAKRLAASSPPSTTGRRGSRRGGGEAGLGSRPSGSSWWLTLAEEQGWGCSGNNGTNKEGGKGGGSSEQQQRRRPDHRDLAPSNAFPLAHATFASSKVLSFYDISPAVAKHCSRGGAKRGVAGWLLLPFQLSYLPTQNPPLHGPPVVRQVVTQSLSSQGGYLTCRSLRAGPKFLEHAQKEEEEEEEVKQQRQLQLQQQKQRLRGEANDRHGGSGGDNNSGDDGGSRSGGSDGRSGGGGTVLSRSSLDWTGVTLEAVDGEGRGGNRQQQQQQRSSGRAAPPLPGYSPLPPSTTMAFPFSNRNGDDGDEIDFGDDDDSGAPFLSRRPSFLRLPSFLAERLSGPSSAFVGSGSSFSLSFLVDDPTLPASRAQLTRRQSLVQFGPPRSPRPACREEYLFREGVDNPPLQGDDNQDGNGGGNGGSGSRLGPMKLVPLLNSLNRLRRRWSPFPQPLPPTVLYTRTGPCPSWVAGGAGAGAGGALCTLELRGRRYRSKSELRSNLMHLGRKDHGGDDGGGDAFEDGVFGRGSLLVLPPLLAVPRRHRQ